jgi:hypothetical protein
MRLSVRAFFSLLALPVYFTFSFGDLLKKREFISWGMVAEGTI